MESLFAIAALTYFCDSTVDLLASFNWKKVLIMVASAIGIYIEETT
jgi:hypothetical protein